jgi:hypothetical protein
LKEWLINMHKSDKVGFPQTFFRRKAMSINQLYSNLFKRIRQLRPQERITRVRNLAWLMTGIFDSRSVHFHAPGLKPSPLGEQLLARM